MTARRRSPSRLERTEAWWPVVRDISAFVVGATILLWQLIVADAAQAVLVAAGTGLLGLPAVSLFAKGLRGERGSDQ